MDHIKLWNSKNIASLHDLIKTKKITLIGTSQNMRLTKSKMSNDLYRGTLYYIESNNSTNDYLELMESYYALYHKTPIHNETLNLKISQNDNYKYVYVFVGNKKHTKPDKSGNHQIQKHKSIDYDQLYWGNSNCFKKDDTKTCLI